MCLVAPTCDCLSSQQSSRRSPWQLLHLPQLLQGRAELCSNRALWRGKAAAREALAPLPECGKTFGVRGCSSSSSRGFVNHMDNLMSP